MTVIPSLSYKKVIHALERAGFRFVRQESSHIQMMKFSPNGERINITVPTYQPIPRFLLAKILKRAQLSVEEFLSYL